MEINYNNIATRWPVQVLPTLRRRISAYKRSGSPFKIGITSCPQRRAMGYGSRYDEMIVLYRTTSDRFGRRIEAILIEHYWEDCDNSIGGGGGRKGYPPYYLYIVR